MEGWGKTSRKREKKKKKYEEKATRLRRKRMNPNTLPQSARESHLSANPTSYPHSTHIEEYTRRKKEGDYKKTVYNKLFCCCCAIPSHYQKKKKKKIEKDEL